MMDSAPKWHWGEGVAPLRSLVDRGGVLVIPSESSYALGADPRNRKGVESVFRIKKRDPSKPLPVVIGGIDQLSVLGVRLPSRGLGGLAKAWPGPLTILLDCALDLPASAGSGKLAVRVPGHSRLLRLLQEIGPLTATSANRSGEAPRLDPGTASSLVEGEDAILVDDGYLPGGAPSTMVALGGDRAMILREGRISSDRLASLAPEWFSAAPVEIPVEESS